MSKTENITTLFLDIGGVLPTNGWGHGFRKRATDKFKVDSNEMDARHHLTFDRYELGELTIEESIFTKGAFYER